VAGSVVNGNQKSPLNVTSKATWSMDVAIDVVTRFVMGNMTDA
jgi:hypothetical protein